VAWSVGLVSIALMIGALALYVVDRNTVELPAAVGTWNLFTFDLLANLGVPVIGILITTRRPDNTIGWLFLVAGLFLGIAAFGHLYAVHALLATPGELPGGELAAWIGRVVLPIPLCLLPLLFLLFPTGHLPSPRWRGVVWLVGAVLAGLLVTNAILAARIWSNPFVEVGVAAADFPVIGTIAFALVAAAFPIAMVLSFASVVVRFRRSTGDERLQLKWFVTASAFVVVAFSVGFFVNSTATSVAGNISLVLLEVSIAIAILKHRLYDIDVIIGKAIVYGALAVFITVVYILVVVVIGAGIGVTEGLSLVATAIVAVAFQPMRERAQRLANRLVYGKRATPYEVLSSFSENVGETYGGEDILPRMARLLAEGTGATAAVVWLRIDSELRPAAAWPPDASPPAVRSLADGQLPQFEDVNAAVPVRHQGELLGALTLTKPPRERLSPTEDKLVADLASQAGLVLRNVRLIEDLRSSRQRLVTAQDQERRRIERNLHDGAQQQLVALGVRLKLARTLAEREPAKVEEALAELQDEVGEALDTLRDLARGIYPPLLSDQGLGPALESQARRSPVPASIEAEGIGRHPPEVEAAVYFCVLEALQNASKYANASRVSVRLSEREGRLAFSVIDDGAGFDRAVTPLGSGLQNMSDRVAALDGSLEIGSRPGEGTTVSGWIPV
jgi:signal transduction histidine kinase